MAYHPFLSLNFICCFLIIHIYLLSIYYEISVNIYTYTRTNLSISNGFVSSKIYDERVDFDFYIVNFPCLDGDVPRRPSDGVNISQLIRFARVCNHADDFNTCNECLTAKLLKQGYRYHKLRKAFSKLNRRHDSMVKS